jgi:hypothetical protein
MWHSLIHRLHPLTMLGASIVPRDIIHCIVDEIADISTLQKCALVAPSFRSPAQKRMYGSIILRPSITNRRRLQKLYGILKRNPILATYIQKLVLQLPGPDNSVSFPVLRLLPCLRSLHVITQQPHWMSYPDTIRSDVYNLILSPGLEEVTLQYIDRFPVELLMQCTHLRRITFQDIITCDATDPALPPTGTRDLQRKARPESLAFPWASDIIEPFLHSCSLKSSSLDLSQLRKCEALPTSSKSGMAGLQRLVELCPDSLEVFTFPSDLSSCGFQAVSPTRNGY